MSKLKIRKIVTKKLFQDSEKAHAYLQTIPKTPVMFQKDQSNIVGGVTKTKRILVIHFCGIRAQKRSKLKM